MIYIHIHTRFPRLALIQKSARNMLVSDNAKQIGVSVLELETRIEKMRIWEERGKRENSMYYKETPKFHEDFQIGFLNIVEFLRFEKNHKPFITNGMYLN